MTDELYWDPFDKSLRVDPHPVWKRLRDDAPVYYNGRHDFYVLAGTRTSTRPAVIRRPSAPPTPPSSR